MFFSSVAIYFYTLCLALAAKKMSFRPLRLHEVFPADIPLVASPDFVYAQSAGDKGLGLFARYPISCNSFLGLYEGELLTQKEYQDRYPTGQSSYTFLLYDECQRRSRIYLDAVDPAQSNILRYVNHDSKAPNVKTLTLKWHVSSSASDKALSVTDTNKKFAAISNDKQVVYAISFYALRDIEIGEELVFDYGDKYTSLSGS